MAEAPPPQPAAPSIWDRPQRASRGPVPEHSRQEIATVAVGLADAEGLAATSMRRVATALGTGPASLYRYVANRDELIAVMADAVTGGLDLSSLPSGQGWREDVLEVARQLRALYLRHPWMLELGWGDRPLPPLGPAAIDFLDGAVAALTELAVPARTKLEAVALLTGTVGLFVRDTLAAGGGNTSQQAQAANAAYLGSVVAAGRHPHLAAVLGQAAGEGAGPDTGDLFERVVLGIMAGLLGLPARP